MKKINLALFLGLICSIVFSNLYYFKKDYDNLQSNVLRLHILANSDSTEDQALKIKVRDKILEYSDEFFSDATDINSAENEVGEKLDRIKSISQDVIRENGYDYDVNCELINMHFETKEYENITMPAGTYDALRITIGNAEGTNWWCVMYPPLCLPVCSGNDLEVSKDSREYFDDGEYDILTNPKKYEVRFKILEVFESIAGAFKK